MSGNSYKGWVPTVLGNLSFKILGKSEYPFPFVGSENIGEEDYSILILQKRIPPDFQVPFPFLSQRNYLRLSSWLASKFENENIESAFVLQCSGEIDDETGSVQELKGSIYRFFETKRKKQKNTFSNLELLIASDNKNKVNDLMDLNPYFSCDITINRQGECTLSNPETLSGSDINDEFELALINQAFFFVKDAFHTHKHHDKSKDTLVSAHINDGELDIRWAEKTIKELYRYLIRARGNSEKITPGIMGLFSYIRTFTNIITKKEGIPENNLFERTKNLKELEESIKVEINLSNEKITYKRWMVGVSLLVLNASLLYFYRANTKVFNDYINTNPVLIIFITIIVLLMALTGTRNYFPGESRLSIRFVNLIYAFFSKKHNVIIFYLFCGAFITTLGFYLWFS